MRGSKIVTIYTFTLEWDQAVNHAFDQDDIKTVGKRRVSSDNVVVVAPTRELAELFLKNGFTHMNLEIKDCKETRIHLMVTGGSTRINSISATKTIGPETIDPYWKPILERERNY